MSAQMGRAPDDGRQPARRTPLLVALAAVFGLEALGLAVVLVLLVAGIAGARRNVDIASALALVALTALGALLLVLLARGALGARPWILAAGIVWQLVQLLVGAAALQGAGAQPVLGAIVGVPALTGLVLLFAPPVRAALRRPDRAR